MADLPAALFATLGAAWRRLISRFTPEDPPHQRLWRRRVRRWMKTGAAFVLTLAAIGAAFILFIASQGGVSAEVDAPLPAAPQGGALSIAAAASLLSLQDDGLQSGMLFLPNRHERRAALFQEGAADAVAGFVETVARRRRPDQDLDLAAAVLGAPAAEAPADRYAAAREALRRYNAKTRREGAVDIGKPALAAVARAAAAACTAHEQAVRLAAVADRFGPAGPDAEAAFFRARGEAFAWARLLAAFERDLPATTAEALKTAFADAHAPLVAAATFEPRILFNAKPGGIAPNHLERMATDLAAAAAAARRLDKAADPT